ARRQTPARARERRGSGGPRSSEGSRHPLRLRRTPACLPTPPRGPYRDQVLPAGGAPRSGAMARTPVDEITHVVKDAAYVSVGLGILAFQRIQVRRNELKKALDARVEALRGPR